MYEKMFEWPNGDITLRFAKFEDALNHAFVVKRRLGDSIRVKMKTIGGRTFVYCIK